MQKLYFGVIVAEHFISGVSCRPVSITADTIGDAYSIAYSAALEFYPTEDGYIFHKAEVLEVPEDHIKAILEN